MSERGERTAGSGTCPYAVVVLSPRLGAVLPAAAVPLLRAGAPLGADPKLPDALREQFGAGEPGEPGEPGLLLTLDASIGESARWVRAGAKVLRTPEPTGSVLLDAVAVMDRLRSPGGCPWDAEQTHASLMPYLIEETYELYQALEDGDRAALAEELGDVLLQVLFHARVAAEAPDGFDVDAVAAELVAKLVGRHPHVFPPQGIDPKGTGTAERVATASDQEVRWEELKRVEKRRESCVDGVALGQPAAALAAKLVSRTAKAGLPSDLLPAGSGPGAALFALAARVQLAGTDPETALRAVARRFAHDVRAAESSARAANLDPAGVDPAGLGSGGLTPEQWRAHWPPETGMSVHSARFASVADSYLRFPHLHGDLLTFVAEDDVWLAPVDGGRAWRLSADRAPAAYPCFSPGGGQVAWTSWRDGAPEVHVAPAEGGVARRLTYWGTAKTRVRGWVSDTEVLAVTSAGAASSRWTWAHAVPLDGGPPRRLPFGPVESAAIDDAAVLLGSTLSREPAWWKRYRGGTVGKVWLGSVDSGFRSVAGGFRHVLDDLAGHVVDPAWVAGRIAVLSDHEGIGNVYSAATDGSDLRRHTDHDRFYARHLGTDGARICYECVGELWLLDGLDAPPHRLDVRLGGPRTARAPRPVRAADHLGDFDVDPTGRASVIEVRGTVHWLTSRDGPATALAAEPGVRHRLPVVLDGERAAWITDAEGDDALEIGGRDGPPRRSAAGRLGRVLELAASPDGQHLAAASHDGRLLLVSVEDGEVREVTRAEHGECQAPVFSPDSGWLAWSHPGPDPIRRIRLARLADLDVVDVTPPRFVDFDPVFTSDGCHLAFLSLRSFDPVYDAHSFDLSFPAGCRPHLVPLAALTPSPFDPEPGGREAVPPPKRPDEEPEPQEPGLHATVTVDPEGLADRVVPVPVPEARYGTLLAAGDALLWLRHPVKGALGDGQVGAEDAPRAVLERYDLRRRHCEVLVDGLDAVACSGDGKRIVVRDGKVLRVLPTDRKVEDPDSGDEVRVDLDRLHVTLDPAAEWRQMFDETHRLMRDHFWTPDLADVDWDGVLAEYRPLVERVGSHDDLVDLLWEVNGELGTSHAYVTPVAGDPGRERRQGLLGADLERDDGDTWRIARVLPGESSDPRARSPLTAPGVAVRVGDAVLAVGGHPVDPAAGPGPLLAGTADRPVELLVGPGDGSAPRRVVVVPLADEERLRYQDWVADRRAHVLRESGGRVGYLHLPDMMGHGWAQLHRDLRGESQREALVVDVRDNRGGHVSQLVVEKLARRVIGWDVGRHHSPETYPLDAPRGPVVAVANEFSGSDGDIVTAAIKTLGIGPVVGTRTWGGVIGIDMRYSLVDGTGVTQPRYAFWFDGHGWDVENHGVAPDVEVVMSPDDWATARDPQLDTAIRLALEALEQRPAARPPDPATRPSRRRPVLPER